MKKFKDTPFGDLSKEVWDKDLNVSGEDITSLEGAPKEVRGDFRFRNNIVDSLKFCPKLITGALDVSYNNFMNYNDIFDQIIENDIVVKGKIYSDYGEVIISSDNKKQYKERKAMKRMGKFKDLLDI